MAFDLNHHVTGPGAVTIELAGRLDISAVAATRAAISDVTGGAVAELTFELTAVEHLDVAVVTALASGAATARSNGTEVLLRLPTATAARRILDHCGLPDLLDT